MTASYIWNGKVWTACHECELGGDGAFKTCNIGRDVSECRLMNRGCWCGVPMPETAERLGVHEVDSEGFSETEAEENFEIPF